MTRHKCDEPIPIVTHTSSPRVMQFEALIAVFESYLRSHNFPSELLGAGEYDLSLP